MLGICRKQPNEARKWIRAALVPGLLTGVSGAGLSIRTAAAQTDYFNLDDDRPVTVEDALALERYAFELQVAPLRVEREKAGSTLWSLTPELAYGVLPRTDLALDLPLVLRRGEEPGDDVSGVGGLELVVFHQLNVESRSLPALAFSGGLSLPVGGLAGGSTNATLKAIATRSLTGVRRGMRLHANAAYTLGDEAESEEGALATRWQAGVAADRTFVFQSFLVVGNVSVDRPLVVGAETRWIAGAGVRYQLSPNMAIDAGFERRLGDEGPDWAFTFGTANAFSIRSLIPIGGS